MTTIAITGASGYIGQRLLQHLSQDRSVERILALDIRPSAYRHEKVEFVRHDVTQPMNDLFVRHGVDMAVHLAFLVDPTYDRERERRINVGGTKHFLDACHAAGVRALLIASSATTYGAWPDNPPLIPEDAPLRGKPGFPYVEDKLVQEELAARYASEHPACRVLLTRASVVTGPHMNNFMARYFVRPVAFIVRGANPALPLVHEDDAAEATAKILLQAPPGPYNINATNPVPIREIMQHMNARVLALPPAILYPLAALGWKLRLRALTEAPPPMLDYIRYPWVVDGNKVTRVTDFQYRYDGVAALEAFLGGKTEAQIA
ncbi:MAG: NAD-dependent epimerase/dehydratase family protein [Chloroflexi bacterium]|nr:NAD-dependent epimerase/dehydratase family protein [Chloroflexota bacterium]